MTKQQAIDTVNRYLKLLLTDFPACVKMMTDDFRLGKFSAVPGAVRRPLRGRGGIATVFSPAVREVGHRRTRLPRFYFRPGDAHSGGARSRKKRQVDRNGSRLRHAVCVGVPLRAGREARLPARIQRHGRYWRDLRCKINLSVLISILETRRGVAVPSVTRGTPVGNRSDHCR